MCVSDIADNLEHCVSHQLVMLHISIVQDKNGEKETKEDNGRETVMFYILLTADSFERPDECPHIEKLLPLV